MSCHPWCCCAGADCGDQHGGNSCCFAMGLTARVHQIVFTHQNMYRIFIWDSSFGSRQWHKLRQTKCLDRSLPCVSDHLHCSLGQPRAACRAALSPGGFCNLELPKDMDQTASGMLYAMPSLGLHPHCRKTVNCNCLLTHGCSLTKDEVWLKSSVSEGYKCLQWMSCTTLACPHQYLPYGYIA